MSQIPLPDTSKANEYGSYDQTQTKSIGGQETLLPSQYLQGTQEQAPKKYLGHEGEFQAKFTDASLRRAFIRKVYSILMLQLLVTIAVVSIFTFQNTVKVWVQRNALFYGLSYLVFIITYIALVCFPSVRRRYPGNIIALSIFTLAMSYITGNIAAYHNAWAVVISLGITAAVCLGVTLFACFTKIDFTKLGAYLLFFLLAFVFFGFACMIVFVVSGRNKILQAVYGGIGAILFSLYLCYDTQMIIGGRRYELSEEDYITGAIELYMDVVQIFLMILTGIDNRD